MNLSENSIKILQNFSEINLNLLVKPGNKISTISQMKNILAHAELSEDFSEEFAIYDLAEFLRALEQIDKPKLTFNGGSSVLISDEKNTQSINYRFADKSVITSPSKLIEIPDKEVTFILTASAFLKLQKGITALALPDVTVQGKDGNLLLTATDKKNKTSNNVSIVLGKTDKIFSAHFKAENFKIIPGDYDVTISKQKVSHFINKNFKLQYWIALEPDSEF